MLYRVANQADKGAARALLAVLTLFLLGAPWASAQAAAQLQKLALEADGSALTLTMKMQGEVQGRTMVLDNPRRFVVDLPATRAAASLKLPAAQGLVESLRMGAQKDGSLRIVIGLSAGASAGLSPSGKASSTLAVQVRSTASASIASQPPKSSPSESKSAAPAAPEARVLAAHAPPEAGRDVVVAVDAGHGGEDPGASGPAGTHEKNVTLAIAKQLVERLNREPGVHAMLTRDRDVFVPLRERAERARRAGADLFVSIHADSVRDQDVEGASVYVLSERGASSEAARILADRENAADLRGVPLAGRGQSLASVLVDLSQTAALGGSAEAAGNVLNALDAVGAIRKREVQYAAFVVLKAPDMPSMLVETAYISSPGEEAKLRDPSYQARLADAIGGGVLKYFRLHPPDGTRMSLERRRSEVEVNQIAQTR